MSFQFDTTISPYRTYRDILSHLDRVPLLFELVEELFIGHGIGNHFIDLLSNQIDTGPSLFFSQPLCIRFGGIPAFRFNDRQATFQA